MGPFPLSVKLALGVGTFIGATIAVVNNKEVLYETAENFFNKGAQYCRERLEEVKVANAKHFADQYQDDELNDESVGRSTGSHLRNESDYEDVSTPETSDFSEIDTDFHDDDDEDDDDNDEKNIIFDINKDVDTASLD
ncbi:hypothetical protein G210_2600 [Candida maltosa Xu316]|uniref:Uncharacterized protein n=1 Tax=Candida maltosa (strain Xu316) TaxID=1245528 RepID=M3K6P8_CANMX|nr:hypothetical protein G210_2600 [Candida maltosa Xu316]